MRHETNAWKVETKWISCGGATAPICFALQQKSILYPERFRHVIVVPGITRIDKYHIRFWHLHSKSKHI